MKKRLLSLLLGAVILVGLLVGSPVQAKMISSTMTLLAAAEVAEPATTPEVASPEVTVSQPTSEATNLLKQLETEILPQIESVLTPEPKYRTKK